MAGGLVQISASCNKNEVYYNIVNKSNTQNIHRGITFFKSVYIRRCRIRIQQTVLNFDTGVNYGQTSTLELPNKGSYINSMFIKINKNIKTTNKKEITETNNSVEEFIKASNIAYKKAQEFLSCDNITSMQFITSNIKSSFIINNQILQTFKQYLRTTPYKYDDVSIYQICLIPDISKNLLTQKINIAVKILNNIYNSCNKKKSNTQDSILFGKKIIECVKLYIGDQKIVEHDNNWLFIYQQLFRQQSLNKTLGRMLSGDTIFVPLVFWFCKDLSKALPVPILQKIRLEVTFAEKCELDVNFSAEVLVDYIFLDNNFFSNQKIPIEQIEYQVFNITKDSNTFQLDNFNRTSKELIWYIPDKNFKVKESGVMFNDVERAPTVNKNFYNYLMPYYFHYSSFQNLFCYPFGLNSDTLSGSSNLRIIKKVTLVVKPDKFNNFDCQSKLYVYSRGINYLIFEDGCYKLCFI